jgi:hypothetical protein
VHENLTGKLMLGRLVLVRTSEGVMKFAGRLLDLLTLRRRLPANLITLFRSAPLLVGLLVVPVLSQGQAFVQVNNNIDLVNASSVSVTYAAPETAGNMNIVVVGWNDTSSSVLSVTDDNTNTYVLAAANAGHGLSQAIFYARNIVLPNNSTPTVTVTFNQNAGLPDIRVLEYSGLGTTATVDNWAGSSNDTLLADSGAATTSDSGDLILGAGTTHSHFTDKGTGFTLRVITFPFGDMVEDLNGGQPAGNYDATGPLAYKNPWVMQMVAFSSAGITFGSAPLLDPTTPITPVSGADIGGTSVTITGTNFQPGAVVLFGSGATAIPGVNCVESSGTTITCKTPASTADVAVDLTVINVDGKSSTTAAAYTFLNVTPTITTIAPATGPTNGGTALSITGSNFQVGAQVTIGGLAAGDVVVQDTQTITATSPALPVGAADVTVSDLGASATKAGAFTYALGTGPINYIQGGSTGTAATVATLSEVMPAAQTAGHLNVVIVGWGDTTSTITSITDIELNTYTLALPVVHGTGISQAIYYAKNIVGDTGSPNQITVTFNQAVPAPDLRIFEYSGLDTTSPLDVAVSNFGSGTLADSGACTTTAAVDLIVGAGTANTHFTGPGSGFNLLDISSPNGGGTEHQITSAPGSCGATGPITTGNWVMQAAAFKAVAAPVPGFTISAAPASQTVAAGTSATYTVTVTPTNGFTGTVLLSCASVSLPTGAICGFTPGSVTPSASPVTSSLSISTTTATPVATSTVTVTGTFGALVHSTTIGLTVSAPPAPDFTLVGTTLTPSSVVAGGSSTSTITIAAVNGFAGTVNLTCGITPAAAARPATCAFNPAAVTGGAGTSTLTVSTTAATTSSLAPKSRGIFFAMLLPIGGLALLGTGITSRKKKLLGFLLGCVLFSGLIFLSACGGSSSGGGGGTGHPGTPAGTYTVTVTGTGPAGALVHTSTLTFTVQ